MIALATVMVARAFDFSAVAPTGQTLYYQITSSTTVKLVSGDTKPAGRLTIPSTANGYSVTEIAASGLSNCPQLTSVTVPSSITVIGMRAFAGDGSLTSAFLSEGVQRIGMMAFSSCTSLDTIVLPASLTSIAVGILGNTAYINNQDNWSDGTVLYAGRYLIASRSAMEGHLVVADSIEGIANDALDYCHISQVSLPASLRFIGELAFKDCTLLDTVRIAATTPPALAADAFQNTSDSLAVLVPCRTLATYRSASNWGSLNLVDTCGTPGEGIAGTDAAAPAVTLVPGGIRIDAPAGTLLTVCDAMGRRIATATAANGSTFLPLPAPGLYVATAGGSVRKILYLK